MTTAAITVAAMNKRFREIGIESKDLQAWQWELFLSGKKRLLVIQRPDAKTIMLIDYDNE